MLFAAVSCGAAGRRCCCGAALQGASHRSCCWQGAARGGCSVCFPCPTPVGGVVSNSAAAAAIRGRERNLQELEGEPALGQHIWHYGVRIAALQCKNSLVVTNHQQPTLRCSPPLHEARTNAAVGVACLTLRCRPPANSPHQCSLGVTCLALPPLQSVLTTASAAQAGAGCRHAQLSTLLYPGHFVSIIM